MIIDVNDCSPCAEVKGHYNLEIPDDVIIDTITGKITYWYVLIDGKLFKTDEQKGLKSYFFSTKERAEEYLKKALYWRRKLIPHIGNNCGYDCDAFYNELIKNHKVEFKTIIL